VARGPVCKAGHEYGIPTGWHRLIREKPMGNATHGSGLVPDLSLNGSESCSLKTQVPAASTYYPGLRIENSAEEPYGDRI
jgi:hypothetical protein